MFLRLSALVACAFIGVNAPAAAGALEDAARAGDVDQIKSLLSQGADIDGTSGLAPPVFYAIQNGHEEAALALIKLGADVNVMSVWGNSAARCRCCRHAARRHVDDRIRRGSRCAVESFDTAAHRRAGRAC